MVNTASQRHQGGVFQSGGKAAHRLKITVGLIKPS